MQKRIYLDHSATTYISDEVYEEMIKYLKTSFGNPSSFHSFGREARKCIEESREKIADVISAEINEIYFTGGGTEADNTAIKGVAFANQSKGNHIITSKIEHHAVLNTCQYLEKKGFKITYLPVDKYGIIDPDALTNAITDNTILISIMNANNEVGTIQPIEEIGKIAKENGIYFHTDAIQSFGKILIDINKMNIDLLSSSAHKIYGPKGVGALFIRKGVKIEPLLHGGHHENNKRAGTENVPGIIGFGKAAEIAKKDIENNVYENIRKLRDYLQKGITDKIDEAYINGHPEQRLPVILNVSFKFIEGESIILKLDGKGIAVSSASACTSGDLNPSHVLIAMGVDAALSQGSIRFSLGKKNTKEEMDTVLSVLPEIIKNLREMSPFSSVSDFPEDAGPQLRH
ncbi:cysteine desulfurase NifS [candidate division KSB1 bacterium]